MADTRMGTALITAARAVTARVQARASPGALGPWCGWLLLVAACGGGNAVASHLPPPARPAWVLAAATPGQHTPATKRVSLKKGPRPQQWAAHRTRLRRLARWPACSTDGLAHPCDRPHCQRRRSGDSSNCRLQPGALPELAREGRRVAADAEAEVPQRPPPW